MIKVLLDQGQVLGTNLLLELLDLVTLQAQARGSSQCLCVQQLQEVPSDHRGPTSWLRSTSSQLPSKSLEAPLTEMLAVSGTH